MVGLSGLMLRESVDSGQLTAYCHSLARQRGLRFNLVTHSNEKSLVVIHSAFIATGKK